MKTIDQTKQVLIATAALVAATLNATANDGKVGVLEAATIMATNAGKVLTAVQGISEVPAEIADLTPEEADELYQAVIVEMGWQDTGPTREVVQAVYDFVRKGVESAELIRNLLATPSAAV